MIPVRLEEIARLALGVLEGGEPGDSITGVEADSREVGRGDLFVALNTGVRFVDEARARGAITLVPHDQEGALAAIARLVREHSDAQVVAVVGSAGKTTTKDILGALCSPHVPTIWAERSLNNEIGLPLTVCRLEPETEVLITEMGMRGLGQIAELCTIAQPTLVVVPHIGPEHLELLGTVERVAEANAEAIESLRPGDTAVVPAQADALDPHLGRTDIVLRRFDPADIARENGVTRFTVGDTVVELALPFTQRHLLVNTLAALHGYDALGLPLERAAEGVGGIELSPWRGEELPLPGGGFVVNDAYNANPDSMRAALEHLAERAGDSRKIAILGAMAELGPSSEGYHRGIGELARDARDRGRRSGGGRARVRARRVGRGRGGRGRRRPLADQPGRRRPRQGVPGRRARRHRRRDHELRPSMVPVLIAGLDRDGGRRRDRAEIHRPAPDTRSRAADPGGGPATHLVKQGTPTMGGLLILASAVIPFLALSQYTAEGLTVLFIVLACALIGFTDDYLKLRRRRSLGLSGRWKMVGLAADHRRRRGPAAGEHELHHVDLRPHRRLGPRPRHPLLPFPVLRDRRNGERREPHGRDRRPRGGHVVSLLLTFLAIAGIAWIRSGDPGARSETYLDIATLAAALIGGTIGFLWYNAFPAEVMMGDTGSFALGGAIAGFAVVTGTEILLPLIAGIFVIEVLSLVIQVVSFKRTGRRVFLIAPIHHHFEMKAWSETKIMVRFWIVCAIFCASGFALFYRDFLQFVHP